MEDGPLFFKEKLIQGNDACVIFYKEYLHVYNAEDLPIIKYELQNCQNIEEDFDNLDLYNDGVFVEVKAEDGFAIFEATDVGDRIFKIVCSKIVKKEMSYRKQDYIDLLNEMIKQNNIEAEVVNKYYNNFEEIKFFLLKKIHINERKLAEATWLEINERSFIEGYLSSAKSILKMFTDKENNM